MTEFVVSGIHPTENELVEKEEPTRSAADERADKMRGLDFEDVTIEEKAASDGGEKAQVVETPDGDPREGTPTEPAPAPADIQRGDITDDPVDWLPGHFIDEIQGVPTLNRKGYAVMCERFGVSVTSEPVTLASETDFEYAEFKAVATTEDGTEYSGFGSAHVNRKDGDDKHLLNELAETRAMKRAAAWATGIGMTAASEMRNTLD